MMEISELERLILLCGNDREKQEQAAEALYVFLYTNPGLFRLEKLDWDARSDFMFSLWISFRKLPLRFAAGKGNLLPYLQVIVMRNFKSWQRKRIKQTATEKTVYGLLVQECSQTYCAEPEAVYGDAQTEACGVNFDKVFDRILKLTPLKLLILGLKSFMFLTPAHVKKISQYTGYDENSLWAFKSRLEHENRRKIERFNRHMRGINTSYILRSRYQWELQHVKPDSQHYAHIEHSYMIQNRRWHEKIQRIPNPVLASNAQIAELLSIPKRSVDTFMTYVRKKKLL